jgi:hypothetical protein
MFSSSGASLVPWPQRRPVFDRGAGPFILAASQVTVGDVSGGHLFVERGRPFITKPPLSPVTHRFWLNAQPSAMIC